MLDVYKPDVTLLRELGGRETGYRVANLQLVMVTRGITEFWRLMTKRNESVIQHLINNFS